MLPPVGSKVTVDGATYKVTAHGCANMRAGASSCPHEAEAVTITRRTAWFCVPASSLGGWTPPPRPRPRLGAPDGERMMERRALSDASWVAYVERYGFSPTWRPQHSRDYARVVRPQRTVSLDALLTSDAGAARVERGQFI